MNHGNTSASATDLKDPESPPIKIKSQADDIYERYFLQLSLSYGMQCF